MSSKKTGIDQSLVRDLAALLNEANLTEIEIEQDDLRIRVSRELTRPSAPPPAPFTPAAAPAPISGEASKDLSDPIKHPGMVPSPMVGTAYLSPEPGADPYVSVGDTVQKGQTIMIVEAMKTMNQIAAPRPGKIVAILVEDTQPVEYGEPLMIID
jgi:acetyl-CoA carboxylase biotin carboxyl carrier protein